MDNNILNNINYIISRTSYNRQGVTPDNYKPQYTILNNDENKLNHLLHNDYSEAFNKFLEKKVIFRGVSNKTLEKIDTYGIMKPGIKNTQNSAYNLYTRLFSGILPSWKQFPHRNKSFICTSSSGKALCYTGEDSVNMSNLYVVFPRNGAKIGICPNPDIWDSFETIKHIDGLEDVNLNNFQSIFMDFIDLVGNQIGKLINLENKNENKNFKYFKLKSVLDFSLDYKSNSFIITILNSLSQKLEIYIDKIIEKIKNEYKYYTISGGDRYIADNTLILLKEMKKYNTTNILKFLDIILNAKKIILM